MRLPANLLYSNGKKAWKTVRKDEKSAKTAKREAADYPARLFFRRTGKPLPHAKKGPPRSPPDGLLSLNAASLAGM
jgi:hypothetical protein